MTYDPDLIDRLVPILRRDARPAPICTDCACSSCADCHCSMEHAKRDRDRDAADQLEAARREVERLARLQSTTVRIAMEEAGVSGERRVNLQQANLALLAERDLMAPVVTAVERWRNVCDPNGWSREAENLSDEGEAVLDAIDAYRAAKGKT